MQLYNSGENARSYIGVFRTYYLHDQWAILSFSVRHLFQFRFWPHRHNCHVILRQHAAFHQYWITRGGDYDVLSIFKMTAAVAQFYFCIAFFEKVSVYQHTTYRQDNSIHGRDITFSVLQKQTSAILKYFFRFWLWPHHRNPYDTGILHKVARLHLYRTTQCRNMTSHRFFKMAAAAVQYYFRFSTC